MAIITINPDKTISINGKKTFPVSLYSMCHATIDLMSTITTCDPSKCTDFLANIPISSIKWPQQRAEIEYWRPLFEQSNIFWVAGGNVQSTILTQSDIDSPYFFGYIQIDEPDLYTDVKDLVSKIYTDIKKRDPNHPVILNIYSDPGTWLPYTDILTYDRYSIRASKIREDCIYDWERQSAGRVFANLKINEIDKPIYAVIQANGLITFDEDPILVPTIQEARALTYTAICLDVKGITYWPYKNGGSQQQGLFANPTLYDYYKQLARELKLLNDILVMPTRTYYHYNNENTSLVIITPNPTKSIYGYNMNRFSYILKQNGNTWYLFVVNKDINPIANVNISIQGLTGSMTARTIGLSEAGSIPGRTLPVTDGQFTDSFDGLAVHIYQIGEECPTPLCDFTITQL